MDDRVHAPWLSKTPGTFYPGAPPSGGRGRASTGREKAMPKAELPPEAPKPDASESSIKQFILDNSVCFYHARGQQCPSMVAQGYCPYSHAQQPVPWGAYARVQWRSSSDQTKHDVIALQEEVLTIAIEQLQYSKSALDDTPMAPDLHDDEPSEAEALFFN